MSQRGPLTFAAKKVDHVGHAEWRRGPRVTEIRRYYGMGAWELWTREHPLDLTEKKRPLAELATEPIFEVHTFRELQRKVAFLNVMNKTSNLLYRGQHRDRAFAPTLLRNRWTPPRSASEIFIDDQRKWYWDELERMCALITAGLDGRMPRWRPFKYWPEEPWLRVAPWSVIQHYELWPSPMLDFTSSLRVAASFALGTDSEAARRKPRTDGYVYVNAFDEITGDLMDLNSRSATAVVRLSSVCPPTAERPHLQEGFLVGNPNLSISDLTGRQPSGPVASTIATFHLVDAPSDLTSTSFWDDDFPRHTEESLLPAQGDELGEVLRHAFEFEIVAGRVRFSLSSDSALET